MNRWKICWENIYYVKEERKLNTRVFPLIPRLLYYVFVIRPKLILFDPSWLLVDNELVFAEKKTEQHIYVIINLYKFYEGKIV